MNKGLRGVYPPVFETEVKTPSKPLEQKDLPQNQIARDSAAFRGVRERGRTRADRGATVPSRNLRSSATSAAKKFARRHGKKIREIRAIRGLKILRILASWRENLHGKAFEEAARTSHLLEIPCLSVYSVVKNSLASVSKTAHNRAQNLQNNRTNPQSRNETLKTVYHLPPRRRRDERRSRVGDGLHLFRVLFYRLVERCWN